MESTTSVMSSTGSFKNLNGLSANAGTGGGDLETGELSARRNPHSQSMKPQRVPTHVPGLEPYLAPIGPRVHCCFSTIVFGRNMLDSSPLRPHLSSFHIPQEQLASSSWRYFLLFPMRNNGRTTHLQGYKRPLRRARLFIFSCFLV